MSENEKKPVEQPMFVTRREFVVGAVAGAAVGAIATGVSMKGDAPKPAAPASAPTPAAAPAGDKPIKVPSYITVDYAKCTGCRICEVDCALHHTKKMDLSKSKIKVYYYNPPVDIPSICSKCNDSPCVKACPEKVGALTKDKTTGAVLIDEKKCIACWACIEACDKDRAGVLRKSLDEKTVDGFCDLCGGDPTCVKSCPDKALSIVPVYQDGRYFAVKPEKVAEAVSKNIYRSGGHA